MDTPADPQLARTINCLERLVDISGRSRRSLDRELEFGTGLSKIFRGEVRLQMSHVLRITRALGVDPGQFLLVAVPPQGKPSPLLDLLRAEDANAADRPAGAESYFDRQVLAALARLLGLQA